MDVGLLVVVLGSSWRVRLWCRRQMKMAGGAAGERGVCKCKFYVGERSAGAWGAGVGGFYFGKFCEHNAYKCYGRGPIAPV